VHGIEVMNIKQTDPFSVMSMFDLCAFLPISRSHRVTLKLKPEATYVASNYKETREALPGLVCQSNVAIARSEMSALIYISTPR
jgi:hypothetical protein